MRFEGKHAYFKSVAHRGRNYRNVCKSLAVKHQLLQAYYMSQHRYLRCDWSFEKGHLTPIEALPEEMAKFVHLLLPNVVSVTVCDEVSFRGTAYKSGLCVTFGFHGGLPDFTITRKVFVYREVVFFICVKQISWFDEQRHSFYLESISVNKYCVLWHSNFKATTSYLCTV